MEYSDERIIEESEDFERATDIIDESNKCHFLVGEIEQKMKDFEKNAGRSGIKKTNLLDLSGSFNNDK